MASSISGQLGRLPSYRSAVPQNTYAHARMEMPPVYEISADAKALVSDIESGCKDQEIVNQHNLFQSDEPAVVQAAVKRFKDLHELKCFGYRTMVKPYLQNHLNAEVKQYVTEKLCAVLDFYDPEFAKIPEYEHVSQGYKILFNYEELWTNPHEDVKRVLDRTLREVLNRHETDDLTRRIHLNKDQIRFLRNNAMCIPSAHARVGGSILSRLVRNCINYSYAELARAAIARIVSFASPEQQPNHHSVRYSPLSNNAASISARNLLSSISSFGDEVSGTVQRVGYELGIMRTPVASESDYDASIRWAGQWSGQSRRYAW